MVTYIALIWTHFVADFILQSDELAKNKSSSWSILLAHSTIYCAPFIWMGYKFMVITLFSHFIIDAISSRISKYFNTKGQHHWFFVTIGADQAIHLTLLILCTKLNYA